MTIDSGVILGLTLQAAALVWGASAISVSVRNLTVAVAELKGSMHTLDSRVQNHETRVTVLEHTRGLHETE